MILTQGILICMGMKAKLINVEGTQTCGGERRRRDRVGGSGKESWEERMGKKGGRG